MRTDSSLIQQTNYLIPSRTSASKDESPKKESLSSYLTPRAPTHPEASEDRNLRFVIVASVAVILLVNVLAMIYRGDGLYP